MANNGNRGKFSDRIKKIRLDRLRRQRKFTLEDSEVMYKNFLKVVAVIPVMVAENIFDKPKEETKQTNNAVDSSLNDSVQVLDNQVYYFRKKKINREKIEGINVSLIKKRQNEFFKNNDIYNNSIKKETIINNSIGNTEKPSRMTVPHRFPIDITRRLPPGHQHIPDPLLSDSTLSLSP